MTWRLLEYQINPFFDPANSLLLLLTGPLDGEKLVDFGLMLMPELREWELQNFIIDLDNQEDQKRPIFVPNWWKGSSEQFLEEINSSIHLPRFTQDNSLEDQKSIVMEHLLNMWSEHLYSETN